MARKADPPASAPAAAGRTVLSDLSVGAARDGRVAAAGRAELRQLAARDLGKVADADPELRGRLTRVSQAATEADSAAAAWHQALAEATEQWEASLADFAQLHPD